MADDTTGSSQVSEHTDPSSTAAWRARIARCKQQRRERTDNWEENVHYRRGKPFAEDDDKDRIYVNLDWSKTKAKHANLFSQMPEVMLTPKITELAPAVPPFAKSVNAMHRECNTGAAIDEAVIDCINAAGVGGVLVNFERRTEPVEVPAIDLESVVQGLPPEIGQMLMSDPEAYGVPMKVVQRTTSTRFSITRLSPSELLWPTDFLGSDFNDASWRGRSGIMSWSEAKQDLGLKDEDKTKVVKSGQRNLDETINADARDRHEETGMVHFDEVYYWSYRYNEDEKYFKAIHRIVFVDGLDEPVMDGPWEGQRFNEETRDYLGSCIPPIQFLTLTYLSDDPIPPSDTAVGRPQVLELIKSRTFMLEQFNRSKPIRWYDVNRVDTAVQENLLRGTWQGMIPVNGSGERAFGEVSRTTYPPENFHFDRIAKADIDEIWQISANQAGQFASGERSASEAQIVQASFAQRVGYERSRVTGFLVRITEVLAGLMSLYHDFRELAPADRQRLEQWPREVLSQRFLYKIRTDSTVVVEAAHREERLYKFLNLTGKSGIVNVEPILREIASLNNLDPDEVVMKPEPPKPPPPNVSYRFNGEDLMNPIALAIMAKTGQFPSPEELNAAKMVIVAAQEAPRVSSGPQEGSQPLLPGVGPQEGTRVPEDSTNPNWGAMDKITRRTEGEGS